jgi:hypothetical protein
MELVVENTDVGKRITAASIALVINDKSSTAKINADKITFNADDFNVIADGINLSGYATFDSL